MAVTLYLLLLSLSTCCLLVDQAVAGDAVDVDLASVYTGVEFSNEEPAAHEDGSLFNNNDDFDEYDNTYGNYLDQYTTADPECTEDEHGNTSTIEDVCDVMVSGVDEHLTNGVGGVDGLYKLDGCFLGCPKYKRAGKAANDVRTLWKSAIFKDWNISAGEDVDLV